MNPIVKTLAVMSLVASALMGPCFADDLEQDYDRHARRAAPRDAFPVLTAPPMVKAEDAKDLRDDDNVIGIAIAGDARAYPVAVMGVHELVNDACGGKPIAVSW